MTGLAAGSSHLQDVGIPKQAFYNFYNRRPSVRYLRLNVPASSFDETRAWLRH